MKLENVTYQDVEGCQGGEEIRRGEKYEVDRRRARSSEEKK